MKVCVAEAVKKGDLVLEIGCGSGELAGMLIERGCTVEGFDVNPAMVAAARRRIDMESLESRFSVREMGVEGMDNLPGESFDAAVSTLVFSELSDDEIDYALMHVYRILKPEGRVVIADEVVPRNSIRRVIHSLTRLPLVALTYLISRGSTRPVADLGKKIKMTGFRLEKEERRDGDAFALVIGSKGENGYF